MLFNNTEKKVKINIQDYFNIGLNMNQTYDLLRELKVPIRVHYGDKIDNTLEKYPVLKQFTTYTKVEYKPYSISDIEFMSSQKINKYLEDEFIKEATSLSCFLLNVLLEKIYQKENK